MRDIPNMLVAGGIGLLTTAFATLILIGVPIWWIEDRFGSEMAGAVLIGCAALIGVIIGHWMTHRTAKAQSEINSDIVHDTVDAVGKLAGVQREYARAEREMLAANAKRDQVDEQRVWRLAEQQRRLLNAPAANQPAQIMPWQVVDDEPANNGINYVE